MPASSRVILSRWTGSATRVFAACPIVVAEALANLPAAQRDVIVLIDLLGFPADRAGARLGIGVRATGSRLHRARRALAASIASSRRRSA
jgi:DNA-directed RNA polymerase specialized sigma24 family protein